MTEALRTQWQLTVLALLALLAAMYFGAGLIAPLTLAFVGSIILAPVSAMWRKIGVPITGASMLTLAAAVVGLMALAFALEPAVTRIYEEGPAIRRGVRDLMWSVRDLTQGLDEVSQQVSEALDSPDKTAAAPAAPADQAKGSGAEGGVEKPAAPEPAAEAPTPKPADPAPALPTLTDLVLQAPAIIGQLVIFIGALYFFLLCREAVHGWLARAFDGPDAEIRARIDRAERLVARYVLTIAAINCGLGAVVAGVFHLIGMPGAMLWGVVAAILNFVLYIGPGVLAAAMLLAGVAVFDGTYAVLPVVSYLCINAIEANFVTPTLVGRQLNINPLVVFLSLCLFLWIWGPLGGLVAIPLVVWGMAMLGARPDKIAPPEAVAAPAE